MTKKHSLPLNFICFHRTHRDFTLSLILLVPFIATKLRRGHDDGLHTSISEHGAQDEGWRFWVGQQQGMDPTWPQKKEGSCRILMGWISITKKHSLPQASSVFIEPTENFTLSLILLVPFIANELQRGRRRLEHVHCWTCHAWQRLEVLGLGKKKEWIQLDFRRRKAAAEY